MVPFAGSWDVFTVTQGRLKDFSCGKRTDNALPSVNLSEAGGHRPGTPGRSGVPGRRRQLDEAEVGPAETLLEVRLFDAPLLELGLLELTLLDELDEPDELVA